MDKSKQPLTYKRLGNWGKFGNQLFQIASTIGIAVKQNRGYGFPEWKYQPFFKNPLPRLKGKDAWVDKYLQDYRNFDHCKDLIRHYFEMEPITVPLKDTVFIHFRAYGTEGVTDRHPDQTREYYKEAVKQFPNRKFVVFSDDRERAKEVIGMDCEYRSGNEMEDFYLMSHCDGGIIANSSYSWWAGWLSGGKIVAPSYWFCGRKKNNDTSGLYLPNWIKI